MSAIARYHRLRDRLHALQDTHARARRELTIDIRVRVRPSAIPPHVFEHDLDEEVTKALTRAIYRDIDTLFLSAIRDTERVMLDARHAARDEAQAILDDMTEEDAS